VNWFLRRITVDGWVLLGVTALVLLANSPYLLHLFDPNPLGPKVRLARGGVVGLLGGMPTIDPNIGTTSQALGHLAADDWLHLRIPWWNPYEGSGTALAGEMQSAALFPPTLLLAISNGQLYEHILFELVAGWATYLLLRRLALRRWACAAAAIGFALNGTFAWFGHAAANPVALLPVLLLGLELAYAATVAGRRGGWWLISIAAALSIYAGFPETAYVDALFAAGWFLWRAACAGRAGLSAFVRKGLAGAATGGLLAAPIIVAFAGFLDRGYTASFNLIAAPHLEIHALPQLVLPYIYGSIFEFHDTSGLIRGIWGSVGGYLTMSAVLFGGLGLVSRGHRGLRAMLGLWLALALSRMYGAPPGLGRVLGILPEMSSVVFYRYATPAVEMAATVLLALGLDGLAGWAGARWRIVAGGAFGLVVVGAAALAAHGVAVTLIGSGRASPDAYFLLAVAAGGAVVTLGMACTLLRNPRVRAGVACGLVVIEALVMFMRPELSAPRSVRTDLAPVAYLRTHLGLGRFVTLGGPLQPNYGSYFGLAEINDNDLPIPRIWANYVHARLDPAIDPVHFFGFGGPDVPVTQMPTQALFSNLAGYRTAGVAYAIVGGSGFTAPSPKAFTKVFSTTGTTIYRLAGADPYFTASGGDCRVEPTTSRESVHLTCSDAAMLVRRETKMPGWTARVDGRQVPMHEADDLFQAVAVGAGSHTVSFGYAPPGIRWAVCAFLAGVLWLVLGVGRPRISRRRVP
jgi:hypothetical protein